MSFAAFGLLAPLVRAVTEKGYTEPTPVQQAAIPPVMEGRDLLGCSQTGTGKTAAFALPIIHRLASEPNNGKGRRRTRALILAPTRELAAQIDECFAQYSLGCGLRSAVVYGGVNQNRQTRALQRGVDVIVATPGRFLDLYQQGFIDLKAIEIVVLDEADHMLDMGFLPDVQRIMDRVPEKRQTLLFSATMPGPIRDLTQKILHDPVTIAIAPEKPAAERIEQRLYMVNKQEKLGVLTQILSDNATGSSLIFARTKHGADKVAKRLERQGFRVGTIHGNKSQNARQATLSDFRSGKLTTLVATDIAARGIDVRGIERVVNFDCPETPETFVHRIGRTARAGNTGCAITLCSPDERGLIKAVERHLHMRLPIADVRALPKVAEVVGEGNDRQDSANEGRSGREFRRDSQYDTTQSRSGQARSGRRDFRDSRDSRSKSSSDRRSFGRSDARGDGRSSNRSFESSPRSSGFRGRPDRDKTDRNGLENANQPERSSSRDRQGDSDTGGFAGRFEKSASRSSQRFGTRGKPQGRVNRQAFASKHQAIETARVATMEFADIERIARGDGGAVVAVVGAKASRPKGQRSGSKPPRSNGRSSDRRSSRPRSN